MLRKGINRGPLKRMFVFYSLEKKNKRRQNELNFFALSCSINCQSLSRYLLKMAIQPLVILNTELYAVYLLMAASMNWCHSAEKGRVKTLSIAYVLTTRNLKLRQVYIFACFHLLSILAQRVCVFSTFVMQLISVQLFRVKTL